MGSKYVTMKDFKSKIKISEILIKLILSLFTIFSIFITLGIAFILIYEAFKFFKVYKVPLSDFFLGKTWEPTISKFGFLPLLTSTLVTSFIAIIIAYPLGLLIAIYLAEYSNNSLRSILKPILEILAGIPTVVYGYFAVNFMTPFLKIFFDNIGVYNMLSAGLVMGILILPLIVSMIEDSLSSVPKSLREAGYSLGANKFEISIKIVVPCALSGLVATFIMALSRVIGETMIVALAAGAGSNFTFNPLKAAETITGYIVRISGGDISYDSMDYDSIFVLGLILFTMTLILNIIGGKIVSKYSEEGSHE